jgi:fucose 4-O-acetylase-like acetyltransferase
LSGSNETMKQGFFNSSTGAVFPASSDRDASRLDGIDFLRGLLILLVILGHLILYVGPAEKALYYAIYSFHMALFLALSGYMLNREKLRSARLRDLADRYGRRLLLPWAATFALIYLINHTVMPDAHVPRFKEFLSDLLYPWFHLWFIPALVGMILATKILERLRVPPLAVLAAALALSFAWQASVDNPIAGGPHVLRFFGDKRMYYYFPFFYLGFFLRHHNVKMPRWLPAVILLIGAARMANLYIPYPRPLSIAIFMLLDAGLICWWAPYFARRTRLFAKPLNWLGRNSLSMYLWHPFVVTLPSAWLLENLGGSHAAYYLVCAALLAGVLAPLVARLPRVRCVGRYLMGSP